MSRLTIVIVLAVLAATVGTAVTGTWPWPAAQDVETGFAIDRENDASTTSVNTSDVTVGDKSQDAPPPKKAATPTDGSVQFSKVPVSGGSHFRLPDGTWAPGLNGVLNAPAMQWPADLPWSPIKRKIVDREGKEWYEHADGSYSNNEMMYRSDLGKKEAVTNVFNPKKVQGMDKLPQQTPAKDPVKEPAKK